MTTLRPRLNKKSHNNKTNPKIIIPGGVPNTKRRLVVVVKTATTRACPSTVTIIIFSLLVLFLATTTNTVSACTALLVGRKATIDGSVLASHSDDGEGNGDPRIMFVPSTSGSNKRDIMPDTEDFPRYVGYHRGPDYYPEQIIINKGKLNLTRPIGSIPIETKPTFSYFDGTYGIMNSQQLIVGGESTCSGIFATTAVGNNGGKALLSINELGRIALERTSTARDAIQLMGDLAEEYGFYGPSGGFEGSAESLMVADPQEGFVFHILPDDTGTSAIWVAQRVPDDQVTIVTNMFTIREVNLTDTYNFMGSNYMYKVAERNNLWKRGEPPLLDFTKTFSNGEYAHKYYSGRRIWGAFHLLAPSMRLNPEYDNLKDEAVYPWSIKPDQLLSLQDIFSVHRYYYQGTKYDMTKGLAAGPFGDPDRFTVRRDQAQEIRQKYNGVGSWERPIAMFRTTYTTVLQARSWLDPSIGGVMWLGVYAAHGTCFLPFAVGVDALPESITQGSMTGEQLDRTSAFWTFRYMHTLARLHYSLLSPILQKAQITLETRALELQEQLEIQQHHHPITASFLTEVYKNHTAQVLKAWWKLADELVFLYADGFDNQQWNGPAIGYSPEWLEAVGYQNGPPPPPPKNIALRPSPNPLAASMKKLLWFVVIVITALIFIILKRNSHLLLGYQQQQQQQTPPPPPNHGKAHNFPETPPGTPGTPATVTSESSAFLDRTYGSL